MAKMVGRAGIVGKNVSRHVGKGSSEQMLPSRSALNTLTGGDPSKRTINNYAKATPGVGSQSPSFVDRDSDGY